MINEGGVASQTSYVGTHIRKHTTSGIYILMVYDLVWQKGKNNSFRDTNHWKYDISLK